MDEPVELRLGRPGADGSPRDEVGDELGPVERRGNERAQQRSAMVVGRGGRTYYRTNEMVSSSSQPTGMPVEVMSISSWRAIRRPLLILNELSRSGSL